ncbi:MAG TPA: PAS domain-containing sensor histidine kinase, partial [Candidatus Hydrogenedentes bacterium]|nr:PAS domain-containing sensor histidine kinase [Candidatus Hydrogenedentota bacterium]
SYTPQAYSQGDLALLEAIAHQIGPAVEAALLSEELRESQAMLQSTIESLPFDFFAMDLEGRYVLQNSVCRQHWGNVLGKRPTDLAVSKETRALWQRNNERAFAGETVEGEVEYTFANEKGYYHNIITPIHDQGRIRGILGLNIDITQRKRAELERARLATAIEQAAEIIFMTDPDGNILYVNPAFTRITGYPAGEVLGRNLRALDGDHSPDPSLGEMWDALRHGRTWHGRLAAHRKDGSLYEVERTISPVRDASGTVVNLVSVDRDVTREVEMEAQLRQAQKMEAIGQLAGGVAHDFNNLLQGILGHIDLALDTLPSHQEACEDLRQARQAAEKAVSLTRQLLALGRRQILQAKNLDLNQVMGDLLPILRRLIGETSTLDIVPGAGLWTVRADPGQMEQVLINLCVNARDAMPQGGRITIRTENAALDAEAAHSHPWVKAGRYVLLTVADTGTGIPEYVQDHLFEPFFTTKEVGKGTGLGLSTVYGIVKQHAGYIEVASQLGRGSTFHVYLPAVDAPPDQPEAASSERLRGGTETILVAEDDPLVRNLTARILQDAGYTVLRARSGEEAVRLFEAHADEVALLLLDVVMPKLSGVAAFDRIRAIRPDANVLFTSGYG